MTFKNALCLARRPDLYASFSHSYAHLCKRHTNHPGRHRVVFRDGGVREWNSGDRETELTTKPAKEEHDG